MMMMMMREKGVGISRMVTLLIIAITITNVMVDTCGAVSNAELAEQIVKEQEQQRQVWLYNILLRGFGGSTHSRDEEAAMVDTNNNNLQCIGYEKPCDIFSSSKYDCCPGTMCRVGAWAQQGGKCVWCPGEGQRCGLQDPCCPGL